MKTLLLLLLALPVAGAGATRRVLVEFGVEFGGPALASARREILDRFRRDLAGIGRAVASQSLGGVERPRIRHEYSVVLFGAAVDLGSTDVERLRELPYVRAVHADRVVRTCAMAEAVDARQRVNASALPSRGKGITIAIIDTGIDYTHPDLGGGFGAGFKVAGGYDFVNDDGDPRDDHGHGTHVAGIAAANGPALVGVAPEATLIAYKVLGNFGSGTEADVLAAIERSADPNGDGDFSDHHDVINLSLSAQGMADDPLARAADNATAAGVVVVAGAGNEGRSSIVSVGSPGTSREAITAGAHDGAGVVASFSSRGPTPGLLTFKPDVVAPGVGILSAKMGGGLVAHDGTSMAAPHVAGVCALLRSLHPNWTPADVKAALTSSALPVDATAFVRGAGRIDAQRAHEAGVLIRSSGLSFGLAPSTGGTLEATRTFTIENRSTVEQTLEVVPPSVPNGITLSVTPATLALRPGESRSLEVRLLVDNAVVPFPDDQHQRLLGGTITFTGSTPLTVPWGILRSARMTVQSDAPFGFVEAFPHGLPASRFLRFYSPTRAEMFVTPGGVWDFVASTFELGDDRESLRLTFMEDRPIGGDEVITLRPEDAPLRIVFDARDASGAPLGSRPAGPLVMRNTTVTWKRESPEGVDRNEYPFANLAELFVSSASTRYSLSAVETLVDLEAMDAYAVQHESLRGLSEAKTLTRHASSMIHGKLELEPLGTSAAVCMVSGDLRLVGSSFRRGRCVERQGRPVGTLNYFATEGPEPLMMSGIQIRTSHVTTPALRAYAGAIVGTWNATPSAAAMRIPNGGTATVGAGPVFPYALPGTTGGLSPFQPRPGFFGALDDDRGVSIGGPPEPAPGVRYTVTRDGLRAAGHVSRGVLDVSFGSNDADLEPPTLTSLRIIDSAGRNIDSLTRFETATLRFSAADLDYLKATETKLSRPEATRAWIRMTGTIEWQPLALVIEGSETGNATTLRHVPAGEIYRADLSNVANMAAALFDLRIDLEDATGNRATWTQSPAFSVGTVAAPPRRRSVR